MSEKTFDIDWRSLAVEGVVIVISILLAFAIDAWWEGRQDADLDLQRLARVEAEIQLNSEMMQMRVRFLESAEQSLLTIQSWMGPDPESVEQSEIAEQWSRMLGIGTLSLVRRASEDFLAAGDYSDDAQREVRDQLSSWYYFSDQLEGQYEILREEHEKVSSYSERNPRMPFLAASSTIGEQMGLPSSRFTYHGSDMLSDPVLENLLTAYLIRLKFVIAFASEQEKRQQELLLAIQKARGN